MSHDDLATLDPSRCAELAAPAITRAFVSGMRSAVPRGGQLVESYGREAIGYLIDLRNPLAAGRTLTDHDLAAVYRYTSAEQRRSTIEASIAGGLLERVDGGVRASERGLRFLDDVFALHAEVLDAHWDMTFVELLDPLVDRLIDAAAATAGAAWAVQAPPHEPAGTPTAVALMNRLSTLRYHRADAHAAAWQAAGWTADEVAAMRWGTAWTAEREAIEHDTNVRASRPFAALGADERLALIGGLAALA